MLMTEIEQEIHAAIEAMGLPPQSAARCEHAEAARIVQEAMRRFVKGDPRTWWLSLSRRAEYYDYPDCDAHKYLTDHIPTGQTKCWLIPETEEPSLPVFEVDTALLTGILDRCQFFEYYLVGLCFDWLVIETDHNQIIVVGDEPPGG